VTDVPLKLIRTGRHPHEILVLVAAVVIGVQGVIFPRDINPAVHDLLGAWGGSAYFAALVLFAFVTLYGIRQGKIDGLLVERAGLAVLAVFFFAFAAAVLNYRGISAIGSASFPLALAVANIWRIRQIRNDLKTLRTALSEPMPVEPTPDPNPRARQ
jgi:hypothetical protein